MSRDHTENADHTRRRRFLQAIGALGVVGVAGCSGDDDGTATDTETGDGTGKPTETNPGETDTPTDDGRETDTPTETDPGETDTPTDDEDTPTDTDTSTDTETPTQNIPEDPPTVVTVSGDGTVEPGGTATLTATAENPFLFPIQSVQVNLEASNPDWTVEATGDTNLGTIDTAGSAAVSWEITAPDGASEGVTLTGTFSYETTTDSAETELSRSITVFEPGEVPGGSIEAYYSLDGETPTNQVTGTDATVIGEPTTGEPGVVGDAFGFTTSGDPAGDRSETADALVSGQDLPLNGEAATVGAWFRYTGTKESFARAYQVGGAVDGTPDEAGGWDVEFDSDSDEFKIVTWTSGNAQSSETIPLSPETWYFVVGVVDGDDATMYVFDQNGELDASPVTITGRDQTDGAPLIMMSGDSSEAEGRMDEVRAYSRALSESEVTALYEGSS
jgi:hypothetical protein